MDRPQIVSVVIPAFNEERFLGACLESLAQQKVDQPFEVIVVDNASSDATAQVAESFSRKLNLVTVHESKRGRGAARRRGCDAAHGEIILCTDADVVLPKNWIATYVEAFRKQPDLIGITSPWRIADFGPWKNWILNRMDVAMFMHRLFWRSYNFQGYSCGFRANAYRAVGGYNANADLGEDLELSDRLNEKGPIKVVWNNRPTVSGRRFSPILIVGLKPYAISLLSRLLGQDITNLKLNNVRNNNEPK